MIDGEASAGDRFRFRPLGRTDFAMLGEDIVKRPYITIGFVALVVLLVAVVAATSDVRGDTMEVVRGTA